MASVNAEERPDNNDDDIEEPPTKKLRSVELDLKITVGEAPSQCEYWYQSGFMATQSGFIDTLLASPMMESITREIKLPDVEPETWDLAMKFLDPGQARKMMMKDAVNVVSMYDKYEFHQGRNLCNVVIEEGFKEALEKKNIVARHMLNLFVKAFVLCDSCNVSVDAMKAAFEYFQMILKDSGLRMVFNAEQLESIISVFLKSEKTFVPTGEGSAFHGFSPEDMENPMFARLVMREWAHDSCYVELLAMTRSIEVSGLPKRLRRVTGSYHQQLRTHYDGRIVLYFDLHPRSEVTNTDEHSMYTTIIIKVLSGSYAGWCIADAVHGHRIPPFRIKPLWYVPDSMGRPIPPECGWIPCEDSNDVKGTTPKVTRGIEGL